MSNRALFVGDVTADLTCVIDHVPGPDEKVHMHSSIEDVGGVIANAAIACERAGAATTLVCHVGNDELGNSTATTLRRKFDDVRISVVEGRTTRVVILVEAHGEKRLLLDPGHSFYPDDDTLSEIDVERYSWMHTAVYADSAFTLIERCRASSVPWSLDLEPATFREGFDRIAPAVAGAELVFCNDRAATLLGEDAVGLLRRTGARAVVRTRGANGVEFHGPEMSLHARQQKRIPVTDTTGAGDCLAGWMIGERLTGRSVPEQLRYAVAAASASCQSHGAQSTYPTRADIDPDTVDVTPM